MADAPDALSLLHVAREPGVATRPALLMGGVAISFGEIAARAARFAGELTREGLAPGARVALLASNCVESVVAIHALILLGATLVPVHPRLTPAEAQALIDDAAPARVLREDELLARLAPRPMSASRDPSFTPAALDPELPLAMIYTSGTSGRPKGAVLSRRAFLASAAASADNLGGFTPEDRWLLCMPLCHVSGLSILTRCLIAARPVVLVPRFEPSAVLEAISRDGATLLSVVPTMLTALLERDAGGVLASLRVVLLGGAATPPELLEACARRRIPALTSYGLTESCAQIVAQRPRPVGTIELGSGLPLRGVEIEIRSEATATAAPLGVGRVCVRGPTLMSGYFRGPGRALDPAVDADGFFDTGDLGALDEQGRLHLHARRTDLIVTGGENVYPVEIEQCIEALVGVRRALVFGVPDTRWGQRVACVLEIDPTSPPRPADLERALAERLAPHKRPRLYCFVEKLPLTSSGKLERADAAARYERRLLPLREVDRDAGPAAAPT
jgi:o-succinylbenzoate---CoA ligase